MVIQGQLKEHDYVAAQFVHMRPRPIFAFIGILLLGLAIWAMLNGAMLILSIVIIYGFSSYNFGYCPVDEYLDWLTPDEQLGEFIRRMEVMAPGKAVFITQFAASSYVSPGNNDDSVKSQWLEDAYTYLASYESVKAALYFNLDNGCDWAFYNTWDSNSRQLVGYRDGISIPAYEYVTPSELSFSGFFKTTP